MYERSYGYKYDEGVGLDTVEIAKRIRRDIKTAINEGLLPERWTYSVRSDRFSGGSSIDVQVKNCADAWMQCPGYRFDLDGNPTSGCPDVWCKAGGQYQDSPSAQYHDVLTVEAQVAKMTLERIHGAYNHDGSDTMVDYFDVNYYGHVEFQSAERARFEAEEKARKAARRAALDTATNIRRVKTYGRQGKTITHLATEVNGSMRPLCGAILRRSSFWGYSDDPINCSRCAKRAQ